MAANDDEQQSKQSVIGPLILNPYGVPSKIDGKPNWETLLKEYVMLCFISKKVS
jgi:hypothetical protein